MRGWAHAAIVPQPRCDDWIGSCRTPTSASLAIAAGADVKVVQSMLGHADASMTLNVYGHLFPDRLDEVADKLDAWRRAALEARKNSP